MQTIMQVPNAYPAASKALSTQSLSASFQSRGPVDFKPLFQPKELAGRRMKDPWVEMGYDILARHEENLMKCLLSLAVL